MVISNKKKNLKNYLLLILLFCIGVGLTLYLCKLYDVYDEYQKETPVIRDTLSEITDEELEHFLMENPTSVIYMCTSSDMTCRNYEKDFKKLIKKDNLQDIIVYLNLSNIDQKKFINDFNNVYQYKISLTSNLPAIVYFEDGKIKNILQGNSKEKLTITKTKQFIEINKIGEIGD